MRIEILPIDRLKPAPYNPRVELKPGMPDYERLKRSLTEFELVQPLVWNETTGHVVGGHQRLSILKAEGVTEVSVVIVSMSLEREKALNVSLNNEQVGGQWDQDKLQDLLRDLIELPEIDETLTGFDQKDLSDLLMMPDATFTEEEQEDEDVVTVTIKVIPEMWEDVKPYLDEFLQECDVEIHIQQANLG
ncbi:MAG: ParB N-terminal domain-containing protein [Planctomycetaceae bacterium]|nr:ParB N-terminal domain-containing protein [Planctomycetaceae bacterium]